MKVSYIHVPVHTYIPYSAKISNNVISTHYEFTKEENIIAVILLVIIITTFFILFFDMFKYFKEMN